VSDLVPTFVHAETDSSWRRDAACQYISPALFFPNGTTGQAIEEIDAAKAVCRACPVTDACLEFAMSTHQQYGVWGGTDEEERRRLRRSRVRRVG